MEVVHKYKINKEYTVTRLQRGGFLFRKASPNPSKGGAFEEADKWK
jgi:hypothetical protein